MATVQAPAQEMVRQPCLRLGQLVTPPSTYGSHAAASVAPELGLVLFIGSVQTALGGACLHRWVLASVPEPCPSGARCCPAVIAEPSPPAVHMGKNLGHQLSTYIYLLYPYRYICTYIHTHTYISKHLNQVQHLLSNGSKASFLCCFTSHSRASNKSQSHGPLPWSWPRGYLRSIRTQQRFAGSVGIQNIAAAGKGISLVSSSEGM